MSSDIKSVLERAEHCVQADHYGEAIQLVKPYASEGNREARLLLGIALAGGGRLDAAAAEFSALSTLDPTDADALNNVAVVYRRQGKLHDALGALNEAIDIDPTKFGFGYNMGNVQKDLGNLRAALMAYAKVIEIDPDFLPAYNSLGKIYEELGDYDKAINIFRKGLALDGNNPHGYLIQVLHFYTGFALEAKEELEGARAEYIAAMEALPEWVEPANNLGIIHSKQGNHEEAISAFGHITKELDERTQGPHYVRATNNIGVVQSVQGKAKEAIESFREAVEIDQKNVPAVINLAEALADSGDFYAASVELEKLIELVPDSIEARNRLATMFLQINRYPQALEAASSVLEIQPGNIEALCISGTAHLLGGNYEEAVAAVEKLISANPDNMSYCIDMADIYFKQENYKKAAECISAYLEKNPKDGKAKLLYAAVSELSEDEEADPSSIGDMWEKNVSLLQGVPKAITPVPAIKFDAAGINRTVDESTEIFFYNGPICITSSSELDERISREQKPVHRSSKERMVLLLKQLKTMADDLPDGDKTAFMESDKRMRLELIIDALESRTGLFRKIEEMNRNLSSVKT